MRAEVQRQDRLYEHERSMADVVVPKIVGAADFVAGRKDQPLVPEKQE